jgi:peptidoglycan hydrolase CwlO-like protein
MKKNMIIGMALAFGILSVGALSASAADTSGKCADKQAIQQFSHETDSLTSTLKAKDLELRGLYTYDSIDIRKADALEAEIKELKDKINAAATKYGIPACSRS